MALTELPPQQRFFRLTCDACGRSVHVHADNEQAALDRVRGVWFWQADEDGHYCPRDSEGEPKRCLHTDHDLFTNKRLRCRKTAGHDGIHALVFDDDGRRAA